MSTEFVEVGEQAALICGEEELAQALQKEAEELGFKCHIAQTASLAIERMTFNSYDAVFVTEGLDGATVDSNAVLHHLAVMPMAQRRACYTVLVGDSLRTLDAMQAFSNSVHLVVNPNDVGSVGPILKKGLADFDRLYATYRSVQQSLHAGPYDRRSS